MPTPHDPLVRRFESLEQLYTALRTHAVPNLRGGGTVRVHPACFANSGITGILEARRRVGNYGLVLALTTAVAPGCVELRYALPARQAPGA